jgi:micrococcal nuclease
VSPAPVAPPAGGNCDLAYPDFCIPSPPPDLDCPDIAGRRFTVLRPTRTTLAAGPPGSQIMALLVLAAILVAIILSLG